MGRYLSEDLRVRVIRAIEGGLSRRAAAERFGVSVSSAIRWMSDYLKEGPRRRRASKPWLSFARNPTRNARVELCRRRDLAIDWVDLSKNAE